MNCALTIERQRQHLQDRVLQQPVDYRRDAELANPFAIRLGISTARTSFGR